MNTIRFSSYGVDMRRRNLTKPRVEHEHLYNHKWKRGKITTFSRASARNMRSKMLDMPNESLGYRAFGVTLTMPLSAFQSKDDKIEYFRKFWMGFRQKIYRDASKGRLSEKFFFVWRVELQQNGTPHFHCVCYTSDDKDILYFRSCWFSVTKKYYGIESHSVYSVDIREINSINAYKYISTHASKHKESQLGWQGRQWGIIFPTKNSKNLLQNAFEYDILCNSESHNGKLCIINDKWYDWCLRFFVKLKIIRNNSRMLHMRYYFVDESVQKHLVKKLERYAL